MGETQTGFPTLLSSFISHRLVRFFAYMIPTSVKTKETKKREEQGIPALYRGVHKGEEGEIPSGRAKKQTPELRDPNLSAHWQ